MMVVESRAEGSDLFFLKIVEGMEVGGPLHGASPCQKRLDGVSPDDEGVVRSFQVSPRTGLLEFITNRAFHPQKYSGSSKTSPFVCTRHFRETLGVIRDFQEKKITSLGSA